MPRVGSKQRSVRASAAIQRAIVTFCWLPPERRCTSPWARVSICRRSMAASTRLRSRAHGDRAPGAQAGAERQGDVLAHRALHQQAPRRGRRGRGEAGGDGVGGVGEADRACRRPRWCRRRAGRTPESTANSSSWPWPSRATTPSTSPSCEVEGDVLRAWCRRARLRTLRRGGAGGGRRPRRAARRRRGALDAGAEHQLDDPLLDARGDVDDADGLAVAQHGGAIAERGDLEKPVRDEDDRAAGPRSARRTTSRTRSARFGRQRRGHLVEEQHVGLDGERAGEVEDAQRRRAAGRARVSRRSRSGMPSSRTQSRNGSTRRAGQAEIVGDVEIGDQRRFLVDRHQAGAARVGRRARCRAPAPRTRMRPASARTAPVRILTSVDLPAPLAPISAWTSPGRTDSDALRRAATAP